MKPSGVNLIRSKTNGEMHMKRFLMTICLFSSALGTPVFAADVGVSVSIGQPGFYGQIDIGGFPRPALLYPQPMMIQRVPVGRPPLYLRVPPGHAKHWSKHCHEYRACGERVYFVKDDWYNREYVPRYREQRGDHSNYYREDRRDYRDDRRGQDRNRDRGDDRYEQRSGDRYDQRGGGDEGRGNGNGHGHGHGR